MGRERILGSGIQQNVMLTQSRLQYSRLFLDVKDPYLSQCRYLISDDEHRIHVRELVKITPQ